jgi:tetratricopeptide (TPR) repeat protein
MDIHSDIYALGVILYELLAGKLPYAVKHRALPEMLRVIREQEPRPLGVIHRGYRGDIETIVGKALEKDKDRRYSSAVELAGDIRRHLADEPILARPLSAAYRVGKLVRRYPALVAVSSLAILLVFGFGISMAVLAAKYAHQRDAAETQRARAEQVSGFLSDLFKGSDPFYAQGRTLTARDLLDAASARIAKDLKTQPAVRADLLEVMGNAYQRLGIFDRAEEMFSGLIADRQRVDGAGSEAAAQAYRERGDVRRMRSELAGAEADLRFSLAILAKNPATAESEMPDALNNLGLVLQAEGKIGEARQFFERAVALSRKSPHELRTLTLMSNWGNVLSDLALYSQAEQVLREVLDRRRKLLGDNHPQVPLGTMNLAWVLALEGVYAESEAKSLAALDGLRRTVGPEHSNFIAATNNLGRMLSGDRTPQRSRNMLPLSIGGRTPKAGRGPCRYRLLPDQPGHRPHGERRSECRRAALPRQPRHLPQAQRPHAPNRQRAGGLRTPADWQGLVEGGRTHAYRIVDPPPGAVRQIPSVHRRLAFETLRAAHRAEALRRGRAPVAGGACHDPPVPARAPCAHRDGSARTGASSRSLRRSKRSSTFGARSAPHSYGTDAPWSVANRGGEQVRGAGATLTQG